MTLFVPQLSFIVLVWRLTLSSVAGPQSQIRCGGCNILLLYPQGASNVRCSQCGHISPVSIAGGRSEGEMIIRPCDNVHLGPDSAQLVCSNCRMLLVYPRGAGTVQCSICQTLNPANQVIPHFNEMHSDPSTVLDGQANQVAHIVCEGCHITLMYAYGAQSVKCAVCNHVTNVPPSQLRLQAQTSCPTPQETQLSNAPPSHRMTVIVENPPSLDDDGNEVPTRSSIVLAHVLDILDIQVQNLAVGVKAEADG